MHSRFPVIACILTIVSGTFLSPSPLHLQSLRNKEFPLESTDNVRITQHFYFVRATIGAPPQNFTLLFDTAYAYLRVDSTDCTDCAALARFNRQKSNSFNYERSVMFGQSPAFLGQEKVRFGPMDNLRVSNQTIVSMKKKTGKDYRGCDGVLVTATQGLAMEKPDVGDINLLENLKKSGDIDRAVFAVYLNEETWFYHFLEASSVSFGSWNLSRYSQNNSFTFVPADLSTGMWMLPLADTRIGGALIDKQSRTAVIASSQEKMIVPKVVYNRTWEHICSLVSCRYGSEPYWNCTRHPQSRLSDLTFRIGDLHVTLTPYEYTFFVGDLCYADFKLMKGIDDWMLGTHFMRKYYLLFDAEQNRVGFAMAKHEKEVTGWGIFAIVVVMLAGVARCTFDVWRKYLSL